MLNFARYCPIHQLTTKRLFHFTGILDKLIQYNLSDIGEGIAEVQVKEWHVKVGDKVNEFDDLCEVQSDKAAVTITSRYDGVVKKLYYKVDDIARVGAPMVDIEVEDGTQKDSSPKETKTSIQKLPVTEQISSINDHSSKCLATPAVRRLIKENNLSLQQIQGTGKDGRVLKEDVLKYLGMAVSSIEEAVADTFNGAAKHGSQATFVPRLTEDKVVPIKGYTRVMIRSMSEALKIPHFGYNEEFTMDELIRLRGMLKSEEKHRHVKLTYLPIIIKAVSMALSEYPQLNAQADEKQENMIYKANHNITIAIDTPSGLAVPNIKFCEQKNIWEIATDLNRIQEAGKKQKISREDMQDGTFTLSNIGIIGGTYASPVIFPPQIVIGVLGRIRKLPRFDHEENLVASNIMNVSWSADHRYVDGATLARFSNRLKELIENPSKLIASMR